MEQRNVVVAIVLNKNNEVLVQKKDLGHPWTPGKWCFFGGKLEKGIDPKQALREILKRKIGVEVDIIKFFKSHVFKIECPGGFIEGNDLVYLCRFNGKISDIKLSEGAGFAFLDKKELDSHPITTHGLEILKEYFEQKSTKI